MVLFVYSYLSNEKFHSTFDNKLKQFVNDVVASKRGTNQTDIKTYSIVKKNARCSTQRRTKFKNGQ